MNLEKLQNLGPNAHVRHLKGGYATIVESHTGQARFTLEYLGGKREQISHDRITRDLVELAADGLGALLFDQRSLVSGWAKSAPLKLVVGALIDIGYQGQVNQLKPLISPLLEDTSWAMWWKSTRELVIECPEIRQTKLGHFRINRTFSIERTPNTSLPEVRYDSEKRLNNSQLDKILSKIEADSSEVFNLSLTNFRHLMKKIVRSDKIPLLLNGEFTDQLVNVPSRLEILLNELPESADAFMLVNKCINRVNSQDFIDVIEGNILVDSYVNLGSYIKTRSEMITYNDPELIARSARTGFGLIPREFGGRSETAEARQKILEVLALIDMDYLRIGFELLPGTQKAMVSSAIATTSWNFSRNVDTDQIAWSLLLSGDKDALDIAKNVLNIRHKYDSSEDVKLLLEAGIGNIKSGFGATASLLIQRARNVDFSELPRDLAVIAAMTMGLTPAEKRELQNRFTKLSRSVIRGASGDDADVFGSVLAETVVAITEANRSTHRRARTTLERELSLINRELETKENELHRLNLRLGELSTENTVGRTQDINQARREIVFAVVTTVQIAQQDSLTESIAVPSALLRLASSLLLRSVGSVGDHVSFDSAKYLWKGPPDEQARSQDTVQITAQGWEWQSARGASEIIALPWVRGVVTTNLG